MAASEVAIANRALQKQGAKRISSLTQDHPNARSMNNAYEPVRDALLRKYHWNFCMKRASVAASATGELYEGLNRYLLPNDFMRLSRKQFTGQTISVFSWGAFPAEGYKDWQIENGYIVTADGAPLQFRYQAKVTDPALFDPLFSELLSAKLALETIQDVVGSNVKEQILRDGVKDALDDAKQGNAFENAADIPSEDDWLVVMR